jgi:hypothetical protein
LGEATEPVEVVAADHDRRLELAVAHHLVEGQAELVAQAQADPADARGQALEAMRSRAMSSQRCRCGVVGDQFLDLGVGPCRCPRDRRQRDPAERADAAAEQRAHVGRHEAGEVEGVGAALVLGHLADVVAVVEGRDALRWNASIASTCTRIDCLAASRTRSGSAFCSSSHCSTRPADRQVAVHRVVRAGLVGDRIGRTPRRTSSGRISAALPSSAIDFALRRAWCSARCGQRVVEVVACSST